MNRSVTLYHTVLQGRKFIGLKFYPDKVLQALVKQQLPDPKWDSKNNLVIIENNRSNLNKIFSTFRGVAWVSTRYFFEQKRTNLTNPLLSVDDFRKRKVEKGYKTVPESFCKSRS